MVPFVSSRKLLGYTKEASTFQGLGVALRLCVALPRCVPLPPDSHDVTTHPNHGV